MKKLLIGLTCLAMVCGAALPIANGIIMERVIKSAVEKNNAQTNRAKTGYRIEIAEYDRGLFSSRVKLNIIPSLLLAGNSYPTRVVLTSRGTHGFSGVKADTHIEEPAEYMQWVETRLNGKDPLSIQTRFSLSGAIDTTIHLDAFSIEEEQERIDVHPMDGNIAAGKALDTLTATLQWEGMSLGNELEIGPIHIDSDLHQVTEMIWAGKSSISMTRIESDGSGTNSPPGLISGLTLDSDTTVSQDKKNMTSVMNLHGARMDLGGKTFSDLDLALKLKQIDIASLEQILIIYSNIMTRVCQKIDQNAGNPQALQDLPREAFARNMPALMSALTGLLKKGLSIEIAKLNLDTSEGKISGNLSLGLKKDLNPAAAFGFAVQPEMLFSFLNLDVQCRLPHSLASNSPELIQPLFPGMSTGLFVVEGDILSLDMHIKSDKLFLNGNQVVIPGQ